MAKKGTKIRVNKENIRRVHSQKAETKAPVLSDEEIKAAALAYARYLKEQGLEPGDATFVDPRALGVSLEEKAPVTEAEKEQKAQEAEIEAKLTMMQIDSAETLAMLEPKKSVRTERKAAAEEERRKKQRQAKRREQEIKKEKAQRKEQKAREKREKEKERERKKQAAAAKKAAEKAAKTQAAKSREPLAPKEKVTKKHEAGKSRSRYKKLPAGERKSVLASLVELHDRIQEKSDAVISGIGRDFAKGAHRIASSYKNSRRNIGVAVLVITMLAAAVLIVFDRFTVYEYAYNGKVLGYVKDQEEVTDILDVAGEKLSENSGSETGVEFVANQNITFNPVDSRGKSTDDADTAVNKLIYLTDIETEAFGIYDGDRIVAIVKDSKEAESLLVETKEELSRPDSGMTLVSSEFINPLDIRSINVLLSSVQTSSAARKQMIEGGEMETFHIVEEGETVESLASEFGVETINIYDENNSEPVTDVEQGDKVCIRSTVDPVNVKMVENGKMKETIEFKTIKKESDEYYKGDSFVEQEGKNGVQIFEGTLTKVAGEVTDRQETSIEVIEKKKDKIIIVGTKERPKTAPTGTFIMPIKTYVVTSEFGGRWGRQHTGMDFGAGTGTPIYAADGGKVIRAGWYSGYGLCVDIDHEHGKVTRYGHCSRLLVSAGERVYQGQEIAKVGNTGHSFGSHLHFEVRIDGVAQNPRNFVNP